MRIHDTYPGKGAPLGTTIVHTLGYVVDIVLIDEGDTSGFLKHSARITAIVRGSRIDADMNINIPKTKSIHVCV